MSDKGEYAGACLCGAVRFRIDGATNWCAHCHCTLCQRAHGAAFVTWVGVNRERVIIEGDALRWFKSSADSRRGFCGRCGSSLFFDSQRWPTELHIVRANFDGEIDRAPESHAYFDTHVGWFQFNDDLERSPLE